MSKLRLSLGCWDYDRTRALMDGTVVPDGIDLNYLNMPVEETFFRMLRHREFDVAEMSLSSYTVSLFKPERPFIAIPIFPSRFFRHSCIYVNADAGIREPKDLIGKRIGTPEYQMTAPVWIRGILDEHYGVPVDSVTYVTGGEEEPGRPEKLKIDLPPNIKVEQIGPTQTLSQMLLDGEIDALHTARMPSTFLTGKGKVTRLFPDFEAVEREYFRSTGIFPIMHTLVIRREIYEANRWVAQSLYKAFAQAQQVAYQNLRETAALKIMHPWLLGNMEAVVKEMGEDFWAYGFENNRKTLETFLRYHHQGGLSKKLLAPEDLFAPETFEAFKI
ncbi:ABC transporter substrate-binding protein [Pigmentiphaga sp.]|uniref:ABC transporter substrate-binding protein n=1 Tax=Pigmentiphaga sp. TaxID=1977564 RepID=UPI00128BB206|nr:ABC transporter substrate-binding protein [Pigmentiphaga sp.]MPS25459.1 ABC transporter substrate-binding protein [Alcaligenaceae bacterium SAGV5]MPS54073.1 ABC transporter substrate-binding protein [Alcaligenaceae bacterium SAGV3]MPT58772.1 ABC transporter substrate-binding protein [Alcaligenaceae bacterium]